MYLNTFKTQRNQVIKRPRRGTTFVLKLTSMIDMFTILLVFLLKSFSTEGQIMTVAPDLRLPTSTAKKPPTTASIIVITPEWIILDGKPLVRVEDVLSSERLVIKKLLIGLSEKKAIADKLATLNPKMAFTGNISIQGDKDIPFRLLKKVMFTCGQVGYNNMLLAVVKEEE